MSPFGGFGSTAAIVFVLLVAAVKALWEDGKRHQEDRRTNASNAHVLQPDGAACVSGQAGMHAAPAGARNIFLLLGEREGHPVQGACTCCSAWLSCLASDKDVSTRPPGSLKDVTWKDISVGQLLVVRDDELFPADLLCLWSELPEQVCFIKTTNLDGETNLKHRRPLDLKKEGTGQRQVWCLGQQWQQQQPQPWMDSGRTRIADHIWCWVGFCTALPVSRSYMP